MMKFGVCDSAEFARDSMGRLECLPRRREIDYFEKEWIISLFRPPLQEVGGPTHT